MRRATVEWNAGPVTRGAPMGMTFEIRAVKPAPSGELVDVDGAGASYSIPNSRLFDLLDQIEDRKRKWSPQRSLLPWYARSFDCDSGRAPAAADCFSARDVLASVQAIERELQKRASRYASAWTFHVPQPDGSRKARNP